MKASDIIQKGYNLNNLLTVKPGQHYKDILSRGHFFPTTKAQAISFIRSHGNMASINKKDVDELVEPMLNKHGYYGKYKYTPSKERVVLKNRCDIIDALKKEYNL